MKPIRIGSASRIEIGYDGENGARAVVFDATKWMDEMPGCTAAITAQRADGQEYIAPDVTQDEAERTITWTLTSAETMEGEGRAQLLWMDGERIAKQAIFTTVCHESLKSDATQIGVPEPVWAQQSLAAAQEARKSAEAAKASEIGAQNALEETKGVRDAAKQEIDTKKEGALAGIENAKAEAIVSIEAGKDELAPPVIPEATGTSIVATDSADRPLRGLTVYGKTTQDGTPTEDAPVDPVGTGTESPLRIVTAGRNLAALTPRTESNLGITSSYDAQTGVVTVTGTATGVAFVSYWLREPIPAGVSMVIGLGNGSSDNNIAIRVQSASENANTTIATLSSTNSVVKVTLTHAFEFLSIRVSAGATVNMKMQIGVTVGSDSAGYTWTHPDDPTSVQIIIPVSHFAVGGLLHGVPAISGGNVTDGRQWIADTVEYDAQAGTAQLVQRVGSVTYFGGADENWVKGGSGSYFEIRRADKSSASHGLCTHYPGLAINAGEYKVGFTAATDKEYIRFRPTGYADMTVDQWRARLDASPVTVLYALAEPVTTPITGDELAALAQLRSRYPATTMYNDAGAQMAARYIADTKKYVDDADAEIAKAVIGVDERVDAAMENIADAGKRADAAQTKADENERNIGQLKSDLTAETRRAKEAEDNRIRKFYTSNLGATSIADSDDGAVRNLVIGGRCEQRTTNGYNILPNYAVDSEIKGVTFTVNQDVSITANGTATNFADLYIYGQKTDNGEYITIEKGDYAIHASLSPKDNYTYIVFFRTVEFGAIQASATIIRLKESDLHIYGVFYRIVIGATAENLTIYPMIERGTIAHDYEPYTGGAPSPSPDYPQEIKCVDGCTMTVTSADGTETQQEAIPVTLRGIGDVRDELYVFADGTGKLVRRYPETLDPTMTVAEQALETPVETILTAEQVKALFDLRTHYGGTNITFDSDNGVEPTVNFDYSCALDAFVEYVKEQQGDTREMIYDMDDRLTAAEVTALEAAIDTQIMAAMMEV